MSGYVYNSNNKLRFITLAEDYCLPNNRNNQPLTRCLLAVVDYVQDHYTDTNKFKQSVCNVINVLCYELSNGPATPFGWQVDKPLDFPLSADLIEEAESYLSSFALTPDGIDWSDLSYATDGSNASIGIMSNTSDISAQFNSKKQSHPNSTVDIKSIIPSDDNLYKKTTVFDDGTGIMITPKEQQDNTPDPTDESIPRTGPTDQLIRIIDDTHFERLTKKEDLWLKRPDVFRFDYKHPAIVQPLEDGSGYFIAPTPLPLVPQRQRDINAHTDLSLISDEDYMKLYPNHFIRTRKPALYQHIEGINYDEDFGCIYPIQDFTKEQILDNIIRYPHFFKLRKIIDPELYASTKKWFAGIEPFPVQIELEGELYDTVKIWDSLPESKYIPKQKDFIVDYVIRRYLLEEEAGIEHKYKLHGRLDPFITLFMPPEMYVERGYGDPLQIVKKCVKARRDFFRSINPALKRFGIPVDYDEN